jgi:hypothetical protein
MSLQTWIDEFYPKNAAEVSLLSDEEMLNHALKKWSGLTRDNLEKHDVFKDGGRIADLLIVGKYFYISVETCALCEAYLNDHDYYDDNGRCKQCPLSKYRDGFPCDIAKFSETYSPYTTWKKTGDPTDMINLLKESKDAYSNR